MGPTFQSVPAYRCERLRVRQARGVKSGLGAFVKRVFIGQNAAFVGLSLALRWRFARIAFV